MGGWVSGSVVQQTSVIAGAPPHALIRPTPTPPHPPPPGLRLLVQSGVIPDGTPAAAAAFLRENAPRLDKGQVGELFGHHEDHSIEVCGVGVEAPWRCGRRLVGYVYGAQLEPFPPYKKIRMYVYGAQLEPLPSYKIRTCVYGAQLEPLPPYKIRTYVYGWKGLQLGEAQQRWGGPKGGRDPTVFLLPCGSALAPRLLFHSSRRVMRAWIDAEQFGGRT